MKHLFFAYEIPESAKGVLTTLQNDLKRHTKSSLISWTSDAQWHVSTHVLGSVDDGTKERLSAAMNFLEMEPISMTFWSIDLFPNRQNPRVIVLKLTDPTARAFEMRDQHYPIIMREDLDADTRPWAPHIKLGRIRSGRDAFQDDFSRIHIPDYSFSVQSIALLEYETGSGQRDYKTIRSIPLPR